MMNKVLLLLFLGCTSCATRSVDPELEFFVERFKKDAARFGVLVDDSTLDAKISTWVSSGYGGYGLCIPGKPVVRVNQKGWSSYDYLRRKLLVYHELAHAILCRSIFHENALLTINSEPVSIMHRSADLTAGWYWKHEDCYLYELFKAEFDITNPKCVAWRSTK